MESLRLSWRKILEVFTVTFLRNLSASFDEEGMEFSCEVLIIPSVNRTGPEYIGLTVTPLCACLTFKRNAAISIISCVYQTANYLSLRGMIKQSTDYSFVGGVMFKPLLLVVKYRDWLMAICYMGRSYIVHARDMDDKLIVLSRSLIWFIYITRFNRYLDPISRFDVSLCLQHVTNANAHHCVCLFDRCSFISFLFIC